MPFGLCNALKEGYLKLSPSKCHLFRREVPYLRHIISAEGVRTEPDKISAVKDWNCRTVVHQLRIFLGLLTYYRKFAKNFPTIARPLHKLTEAQNRNLSGRLGGYRDLQEYDVEICYRKGSANGIADALLRRPSRQSYRYCSRIEKKFGVIDPIVHQFTTPSTSALEKRSDERVRKDQLADPEIKPIIEFKESSEEKISWQYIAPFHPATKRYWVLWDSLQLRNSSLYGK
ncbi:retrovirus-related Pol polyprotein from transposon 297 [Trichonephila clavipes]|nr:retrovirus-related Pol polyprotein from transposon 297 [Trichonephila clavipes]